MGLHASESKNPYLKAIVTAALHTGMRRGEILGLTWERVDFARGVLLLDRTKSGRRREVPMNRAVYDALSALPSEPREGLLFHRGGAAWGQSGPASRRRALGRSSTTSGSTTSGTLARPGSSCGAGA